MLFKIILKRYKIVISSKLPNRLKPVQILDYCLFHVMHKKFISILVTHYIQKRRGQALPFSLEYNLLPNLISNFNHYMDRAYVSLKKGSSPQDFIRRIRKHSPLSPPPPCSMRRATGVCLRQVQKEYFATTQSSQHEEVLKRNLFRIPLSV